MESRKDNIDRLLKRYLEKKASEAENPSLQECPNELKLDDLLEGRLSQEEQDVLIKHAAHCPNCLSLLELAQRAKEETPSAPTPKMIMRAKSLMQKDSKKKILDYKWQILAFISFALSFIVARFFLQFLILAVIFSIKWIFDSGSTRTLIMIYQAWRKKDQGTAQRIIQDFQDKIEQRS